MVRTKQTRKKSSMVHRRKHVPSVSNVTSVQSSCSSLDDDDAGHTLKDLLGREWDSPEQLLEAYDKYCKSAVEKCKSLQSESISKVSLLFRNIVENEIPRDILNSKLKTEWDEQEFLRLLKDPNVPKGVYKELGPQQGIEDFKKPATPQPIRSRPSARKRSVSENRSSRKRSTSNAARSRSSTRATTADRKRSASQSALDRFKTPLMGSCTMPGQFITPKLSNTPITMMRRPQMGEVPFSMDGSPLMVNSVASEDFPTVNVPVSGRIFSIIPQPGGPPPEIPDLDEQTRSYLRTLQRHLEILAPQSPGDNKK